MDLSIVATLYRSAPYIDEFHRRASESARQLTEDYEIVLVNDGSPDDSLVLARRLADVDDRVTVVDLSRNFGHHKAIMTGLAHANGRRVFLIDSDLEEEPEWLSPFAAKMESENCDVVFGVQTRRKGNLFERWLGHWFYVILRALSGLDIPANMVTARLMNRVYVDALLRFEERELDIGGVWLLAGFDQRAAQVTKHSTSKTTYDLGRKLSLFVTSVTSFSNFPLIAMFYIGAVIFLISGGFAAWLVVQWFFFERPLSGWTSILVSIWLLGGLILLFLGIVGIYVAKVFSEAKRRPNTIVRKVYGKNRRD